MGRPGLPGPVKDPARPPQELADNNQTQVHRDGRGKKDIGPSAAGVKPDPDSLTAPIKIGDQDYQDDHDIGNQDPEKERGPPG